MSPLCLLLISTSFAHPVLPVNSSQAITQTSEWQFFSLPESSESYLLAEIWTHAVKEPVALLASSGALPAHSAQGFEADAMDESGWLFNKSYHFLQLENPRNATLAVYCRMPVTYDLKLTITRFLQCPRRCSGHGVCVQGSCLCEDHFLDQDCSLFASRLQPDSHIVIPTAPHSWSFLSIDTEASDLNLYVSVSPATAQAQVYVSCAPTPPSSLHCLGSIDFSVDGDPEQVLDLPCTQGLVSMYNAGAEGVMLGYEVQPAPGNQQDEAVYVILAVILVIALSWSCAHFLNFSAHPRASIAQTDVGGGLGLIIISTLFPVKPYHGAGDVCAICLEGLPIACQVRELPCKHVFNVACIDQWFQQHTVSFT